MRREGSPSFRAELLLDNQTIILQDPRLRALTQCGDRLRVFAVGYAMI